MLTLATHIDSFGSAHNEIWSSAALSRAASSLGTPPRPLLQTCRCSISNISGALSSSPFAVDIAHHRHVFLVTPAVVKDNGGRRLERWEFFAEFLTPAVAAKPFKLPEHRMNQATFPIVRPVLHEGSRRQARRRVAATLELLGKAGVFVPKGVPTTARPLYLQPLLPSFAAVGAVVVTTPNQLGLLQTSLGDTLNKDFGSMLSTIARLPDWAGLDVKDLDDVVYCLVGSNTLRVQRLVCAARVALAKLQKLSEDEPEKFHGEVGVPTDVACARICMFRVVGLTLDPQTGFRDVDIEG